MFSTGQIWVNVQGARGFVPLEEAGWTGIEVRLCALLEMERESEDKKDDLPGGGNSTGKGVAGAERIRSVWGSLRLAQV